MTGHDPAVWFPAIHAGTGADVFTETLAGELNRRGVRSEIAWLPLRAEYAPWSVKAPKCPKWANVIHVNTWLHPRFWPSNVPVVATMHHCVHDPDFLPYKTLSQAIYHRVHIRRIERAVLHGASAVIADSQFTAERTRAVFGKMRAQVIPLGIEIPDAPSVARTRSAHTPFRLLFVGSASRRKGADLLSPIMAQLGSHFELWVVGARQFDSRSSSQNVKFKGRLATKEELFATYRTADALLFPSRLEGFGLVCAEAMACGLPVITTNGSSLSEVVRDGVTGILCQQDDVGAFVAAATRLNGDPALFAHMSQAARSHAKRSFSLRRMADDYMQVYSNCI